ncbi:hypothetical protein F53441_11504 [Fusarium austroafricanum]|uniref:Ecp2 effector protein domain-containing protein n=1 Tax=Fusarium austroafricanum TaxID=2364996 RepID=A0A8H4K3R4_9HYPO|nr:hypothetical protein F53441_11504 [Fusarium austroafricanum]
MVNIAVTTIGLFAVSTIAGPVADKDTGTEVTSPFSLEAWASDIIAHPDDTHPSPDEAFELAANQTSTESDHLEKRAVRCNTVAGTSTSVTDAVWCIDFLARRASQRCPVGVGGRSSFCRHGLATIQGTSGKPVWIGGTSSPCGNVARAAGRTMDKCTRSGTVQGENTAYGNGYLHMYIRRP